MSLITPDFGLFFWMLVAFVLLLVILKKFAWKPILKGLSARESKIAEALDRAEAAQQDILKLKKQNEDMAREAQLERERVRAEAKAERERILAAAHEDAKKLQEKIKLEAEQERAQKEAELRQQIRSEVAVIAIKTSERILREHFAKDQAQKEHIDRIIDEILSE